MSTLKEKNTSSARLRDEAGFVTRAGTCIAIWGTGLALLAMKAEKASQLSGVALLILPVALASGVVAMGSKESQKRADASHIHLIAVAGLLAAVPALHVAYFYILAASLITLNVINVRRAIEITPAGISSLFAFWLAPPDAITVTAALVYCPVTIACTLWVGHREKLVAISFFPLLGSLLLAQTAAHNEPLWGPVLAVAHLWAVLYLRHVRSEFQLRTSERRTMLDQVLILLSLSLLIAAAFGLETHWRYLLLGNLFALVASIQVAMRTMPSACAEFPRLRARRFPQLGTTRFPEFRTT